MSIYIKKIKELEIISRQLEGSNMQRAAWTKVVHSYAGDFITDSLSLKNKVLKTEKTESKNNTFTIDEHGRSIIKIIEDLTQNIDNQSINLVSPGLMAHQPSGGLYVGALGDFMTSVTNRNSDLSIENKNPTHIETSIGNWLKQVIGLPESAISLLTADSLMANIQAFYLARKAKAITSENLSISVIYSTEMLHESMLEALKLSGLQDCKLQTIPCDERYRMDGVALAQQIEADKKNGLHPFLIIASAGTYKNGAIDPMNIIAMIAKKHNIWTHIDATYGGFFMILDDEKTKFKGFDKVNSITLDPHKGLFLPNGFGALLINNESNLLKVEKTDFPPDICGLKLWLPLQLFGLKLFRAALEEKLLLTKYFQGEVQKLGFEVLPDPELTINVFRKTALTIVETNEKNLELVAQINADGRVLVSTITLNHETWIRAIFMSYRTHQDHVDILLSLLKNIKN